MLSVFAVDPGRLDLRMRSEICAYEAAIEWPVVLGVGRGVDPDKPITCLNVAFEGRLLISLENVASGQQEDDRTIAGQRGVGEDARIRGRDHQKSILIAESADGSTRVRDRVMAEPGRPREDQHVVAGLRLL